MLNKLKTALWALFRRSRAERELDEELRQHIDQQTEQNIRLGMNPEEARSAARKAFGGVEQAKERSRDARGMRWADDLWQDLRYGARMLLKNSGFTSIAVLTLALGIGMNTALFTVYNAFLLKPLPLKDPDSIANITGYDREGNRNRLFSYLDYLDYRDRNNSFAGLVAMNKFAVPFGEQAADAAEDTLLPGNFGFGRLVSGNYFTVLNAEMTFGRGFAPEEDRTPGTHPVLVLSYICWERRFNSDPKIIGKTVHLAGRPFTIIGVTAKGFIGTEPDSPQFWVPLMMRDQVVIGWYNNVWMNERKADVFVLFGRLNPGVTHTQAQAEISLITQQLGRVYPDRQRKDTVVVSPGSTYVQLDDEVKLLVAPLLTAVGLVLLIACVNVTNMLLARATGRRREIAVRLALGASRLRIVRQLLTESILLAALGGATGLLLAIWAIRLIYSLVLAKLPVPVAMLEQFVLDLSPDYRLFGYALFVSLLAGIMAGLAPALQSSRPNLSGALKDEGSTFGAQLSQSRLRNTLVVMQVAVCLTLLIAAGLLTRNLQKLHKLDTGLVTKNVFTLNLNAQGADNEENRVNDYHRQLAARLRMLSGVKSVSQARRQPLTGPNLTTPIAIAGQEQPSGHPLEANYNFVSADYFQTLGLRIMRGRSFTEQESQANAQVVLISESTARRFWPNENAIGKYIGIGIARAQQSKLEETTNFPQYEIIGLVNDTRQGLIWQPDKTFLYIPLPHSVSGEYIVVKTEGDVRAVMRATYIEAASVAPKMFLLLLLIDDSLAVQLIPFQSFALLAGAFGGLALLLASIGLYGVMSFIVSQRTREIGVRMALGAQSSDVITLFLGQGSKLIAIGIAIGLAGGAAISSLLAIVLVDISQFDPLAFAMVAAILTCVALLACWIPARQATKVDPLVALRNE